MKYGHMNSAFIGTCFYKFHSCEKADIFDALGLRVRLGQWHFKIKVHCY